MGWNGGSEVMDNLVEVLNDIDVPDEQRKLIYEKMIETLTDMDWDNLDECSGTDKVLDKVIRQHWKDSGLELDEEEDFD